MPPDHWHGSHGWEHGSVLPFLATGLLLTLLLLGLTGLLLWRQGLLSLPSRRAVRRPEDEAKRILSERFARGEISTEEFMERASILNWTPGSEPAPRTGTRRTRWVRPQPRP